MSRWVAAGLAVVAAIGLASCDKLGGGRPTGQVVARVGKDEITVLDLQTELGGARAPDERTRKLMEQRALNAIIQRKIVAAEARRMKLDRTPEFARLKHRNDELLLATYWQQGLARAIPAPSLEEAQTYVAQHPDMYGARKRFLIDGISFATSDPAVINALAPLNTLEQVEALLNEKKIRFQSGAAGLDALSLGPAVTAQLLKLKDTEIFAVPQPRGVLVARVKQVLTDPVPQDLALKHATEVLRAQRTQQALARQAQGVMSRYKDQVVYNKAYQPPAPPAAKAAPKGAAPAAPAAPVAAPSARQPAS